MKLDVTVAIISCVAVAVVVVFLLFLLHLFLLLVFANMLFVCLKNATDI